uniref:Uncharacterized protein n=1 Tax=Lepeophtheirus salmonis TaxID=72036 RepID=A0A0K2TGH5_LEPSM
MIRTSPQRCHTCLCKGIQISTKL